MIAPAAEPEPCPELAPAGLECWTVAVPVDPDDPAGPTLELGVTTYQADPTSWNSPVLKILSHAQALLFEPATTIEFFGDHDLIWIDHRGQGRSAAYPRCDELATHTAQLNTIQIDDEVAQLLRDCVQPTLTADVPLSSVMDQDVTANDFGLVRQALGIDQWAIYAASLGTDIAFRMIEQHPKTVTALLTLAPSVAGVSQSAAGAETAFRSFAADCAAIPTCAANGDLSELLDAAIDRLGPGVTTTTVDPTTGGFVRLDVPSVLNGITVAMSDAALAPVLPSLIAGLADGSADDVVAGFYVSRAASNDPIFYADDCPTLGYIRPAVSAFGDTSESRFGAMSWAPECEALGPIPPNTEVLPAESDIPVLALLPAWSSRATLDVAAEVFAGFPNTTIVQSPGIAQISAQLPECQNAVAIAFFDDSSGPVDTTCLTDPAVRTLQ